MGGWLNRRVGGWVGKGRTYRALLLSKRRERGWEAEAEADEEEEEEEEEESQHSTLRRRTSMPLR